MKILLFIIIALFYSSSFAAISFENCSDKTQRKVKKSRVNVLKNLDNIMTFAGRPAGMRFSNRERLKYKRAINKIHYVCEHQKTKYCDRPKGPSNAYSTIYGGFLASKEVVLCMHNINDHLLDYSGRADFCRFTGIIAHEAAHVANISYDKKNHSLSSEKDKVYALANWAEHLCLSSK